LEYTFEAGNGGTKEDLGIHKENNCLLLLADTFKLVAHVPTANNVAYLDVS